MSIIISLIIVGIFSFFSNKAQNAIKNNFVAQKIDTDVVSSNIKDITTLGKIDKDKVVGSVSPNEAKSKLETQTENLELEWTLRIPKINLYARNQRRNRRGNFEYCNRSF